MSVNKFKFVSPGVFIEEIDNSFIPRTPDAIGPVVVGRASRGPAMLPIKVESYSDFVETFGDTVPGFAGGDVSRDGNMQSPIYGTYAAKAFLRSNVAPLTYVRLLGQQSADNDGTDAARAGWKTSNSPVRGATEGGAFGLFVADGDASSDGLFTGSARGFHLGAVIYMNSGSLQLSGTIAGTSSYGVQASSTIVKSDANGNFNLVVNGGGSVVETKKFTVNFNDDSADFIRKRLNTNPQRTSTPGTFFPTGSYENYWLGESFEQYLRGKTLTSGQLVGVIAGIASGSTKTVGPHQMKGQPSQEAIAGWFIGQDLGDSSNFNPENASKLFRLIGRGHGEWLHKNVKVSIEKIRQSNSNSTQYGSFSVVLRSINDTDVNTQVLERFDNCNLDPSSPDFVARKIGDKYYKWNETERRLREYGEYDNNSRYVRVEVDEDIEAGVAGKETLVPFGYFGPPKFRDMGETSGLYVGPTLTHRFLVVGNTLPGRVTTGPAVSSSFDVGAASGSFFFPKDTLRTSATDNGISDQTKAYFGFSNYRSTTSTRSDRSVADAHRLLYIDLGQADNVPVDTTADTYNAATTSAIEGFSYVFTLDDVSGSGASNPVYTYVSGSRQLGTSTSARSGNTYETLLNSEINQFTAPFWGGFDGVDISKPDPFRNLEMSGTPTNENNYVFYTFKRAIDTVADPEMIDMNLLAVPGLTNDNLTGHMIDVCEERADALALIDLSNVYIPPHERYYSDKSSRIPANPTQRANDLKDRRIDSSYGATYYPWVQTRDANTGQLVWIPPTVAIMGVLGSSERQSEVWFAPAGFNRGGLTQGAAGIPVTNVTERLTSKDRDRLYESRINPIASFPSSGIVVFGQKTLQERQSALDRINVRRLVIFLKKQISILSTQILFEQNVEATWTRFKGLVEPFLANVKTRFGITEYRLVLDNSTTTPDLVDQNVLYAKIMIKPARAIEYIAIDFVVMNTGASFDD